MARTAEGPGSVPDLARLLRQLRRRDARSRSAREITYRELAAKTGWSHAVIGDYFTGRTLPPTDRFDVLIRLLGAGPAEQSALASVRDSAEEAQRTSAARAAGGVRLGGATLVQVTSRLTLE